MARKYRRKPNKPRVQVRTRAQIIAAHRKRGRRQQRRRNPKSTFVKDTVNVKVKEAPVSKGNTMTMKDAHVKHLKNGNTLITKSEYLTDVKQLDADDFVQKGFMINPALVDVFPWLSQVVRNYSQYRFNKLHFRFVTSQSTGLSGNVYLIPDFNVQDAPPYSKVDFAQYAKAKRTSVWQNMTLSLTRKDFNQYEWFFTRITPLDANKDIKTYDCMNLYVCTSGISSPVGTQYGELWVDYEVEMKHTITPDQSDIAYLNSQIIAYTLPEVLSLTDISVFGTSVQPYTGLVQYGGARWFKLVKPSSGNIWMTCDRDMTVQITFYIKGTVPSEFYGDADAMVVTNTHPRFAGIGTTIMAPFDFQLSNNGYFMCTVYLFIPGGSKTFVNTVSALGIAQTVSMDINPFLWSLSVLPSESEVFSQDGLYHFIAVNSFKDKKKIIEKIKPTLKAEKIFGSKMLPLTVPKQKEELIVSKPKKPTTTKSDALNENGAFDKLLKRLEILEKKAKEVKVDIEEDTQSDDGITYN